MRGIDVSAKIRTVVRATGCVITLAADWFEAIDPESGKQYVQSIQRGDVDMALHRLHERIYRDRGEARYRAQGGCCAECDERILRYEIDHIKTRAKGRDDRSSNLRALCHDCHARRHGG